MLGFLHVNIPSNTLYLGIKGVYVKDVRSKTRPLNAMLSVSTCIALAS